MNITKELFEAVNEYPKENVYIQKFELEKDYISILFNVGSWEDWSYNDFFFKCKEWALNKGYMVSSSLNNSGEVHGFCYIQHSNGGEHIYYSTSYSEQQAVFDACTYILENK